MQTIKRATFVFLKRRRVSFENRMTTNLRAVLATCTQSGELPSHSFCSAVDNSLVQIKNNENQTPEVVSLLEVTQREGLKPDDVLSALRVSPELLTKSPLLWQKSIKGLKFHGFKSLDTLKMITMYPTILTLVEKDQLDKSISQWLDCDLGYNNVLDLLSSCPHFLSANNKDLKSRIPLLQSIVDSKGKLVTKLLKSCPDLLFTDLRTVETKIKYVEDVMMIDTTKESLAKCYMFNRSLNDIKTRHIFLQRAGYYVLPGKAKGTKKEQASQPWSKNPRLSQITDTSDANFISQIARDLTVEELEVFKEMYLLELEDLDDSDEE